MGDDWKPGDLAMKIRNEPSPDVISAWSPPVGGIVTVSAVYLPDEEADWLGLDFFEDPEPLPDCCWDAANFVKVTPPKADEFDREVIELMAGKPIKVRA